MKKSTVLLLFVVLIAGCGRSTPKQEAAEVLSEPYTIKLDPSSLSSQRTLQMSDVVDSIEYIKLEFRRDYPIGGINSLQITDENIFLDCDNNVGVLQYTRDGRFVRKIGAYGRGPGEYLMLRDFAVDSEGGIIYLIANWKKVIDHYDLHTGKFLGEIPLLNLDGEPIQQNSIMHLFHVRDNLYMTGPYERGGAVHRVNGLKNLSFFNIIDISTGRTERIEKTRGYISEELGFDVETSSFWKAASSTFRDSHNRWNIKEAPSDTIYSLNADLSLSPRIILELGEYKRKLAPISAGGRPGDNKSKITMNPFYESARYIFCNFALGGEKYVVGFDKTNGDMTLVWKGSGEESKGGLYAGLFNDIDGGFSNPWGCDNKIWYRTYPAYQMIEELTPEHFSDIAKGIKFPDRAQRLRDLTESLTEDDNPVIAIYHLKRESHP